MEKEQRLNNTQRKALAQLIEAEYGRRVQEERDKNGELVGEITDKVKVELGVDTIDNQVDTLKRQIQVLLKQKEQLGFSEYGHLLNGSKAQKLIEGRTKQQSKGLQDLEHDQREITTRIWLAQSVEEAQELLNSVLQK